MDAKTRDALERSIAAWEAKAKKQFFHEVSTAASDCPLCVIYLLSARGCKGCPIQKSGERDGVSRSGCENTPYPEFYSEKVRAVYSHDIAVKITKKGRRLIQAEIDFLKSLLPE
jgi:hypothetical protein